MDILDKEAFARELARLGGAASKADTIAYRTRRTITERMDLDPAFYKRFSELLEQTIAEFRAEHYRGGVPEAGDGAERRGQQSGQRLVPRADPVFGRPAASMLR